MDFRTLLHADWAVSFATIVSCITNFRVIEYGEGTNNQLYLLLLDWEKAFDKVKRPELMNSMKRMQVEPKLVSLVEMLYGDTQFKIEIEGFESEWMPQQTGIRQGCPLSPDLFLIIMTTLFHDTHTIWETN